MLATIAYFTLGAFIVLIFAAAAFASSQELQYPKPEILPLFPEEDES